MELFIKQVIREGLLFGGLLLVYIFGFILEINNTIKAIGVIIGIIMVISSFVYVLKKCRCFRCKRVYPLGRRENNYYPHCGERII